MKERLARLLVLSLALAGLDQAVKAVVVHYLDQGQVVTVIDGFFDLVLTYNRGAAFSSLANFEHARWLLVALTILALVLAFWLVGKGRGGARLLGAMSLVCGGALGNLIDRLRLGRVVDFLDFQLAGWHWPAFNLADAAITVGGCWLAWRLLRDKS